LVYNDPLLADCAIAVGSVFVNILENSRWDLYANSRYHYLCQ